MFEAKISDSARVLVGLLLTVSCGAPGAEPDTDHHYTNGLQFSYLST